MQNYLLNVCLKSIVDRMWNLILWFLSPFSFVLCSFDFSFFYFFLPLLYCNRCRHRIWSCIRRRKLSGGCIEISCWCGKFILFLALVGIFFCLIQIYPFEALEFLTWWFFFLLSLLAFMPCFNFQFVSLSSLRNHLNV